MASLAFSGHFLLVALAAATIQGKPSVGFAASGPGGLQIVGHTSEMELTRTASSVSITVQLAHLTTGIDLRDRHMTEKYLEVGKYPNAILILPTTSIKPSATRTETSVPGQLTLHGVTREVTVHYVASLDAPNTYSVQADFALDLKDFGIEQPRYLGVSVKTQILANAAFHLSYP